MRIQDRINAIEGVSNALWDSRRNRLVVYYLSTIPVFTIKVRIAKAIGDACLQEAIEEVSLISL